MQFAHMIEASSPKASFDRISRVHKDVLHQCNSCGLEHYLLLETEVDKPPTVAILRVSRIVNVRTGVVERQPVVLPGEIVLGNQRLRLVSTASHSGASGGGHYNAIAHSDGIW